MQRLSGLLIAATLAAVAAAIPAASPASAQGWSSPPIIDWEYQTRRPSRGFSGWVRQGNRSYYCDYV
ncbi:MAG: hypothetical protein AB7G35_21205, partial [Hyphomicrobiaceae bacterium]